LRTIGACESNCEDEECQTAPAPAPRRSLRDQLLRWINLAAAVLGAVGAIVLFNGSFAYESFAPYYGRDRELLEAQSKSNRIRRRKQRIGIGLILASFVVQGAAQLFD
jgi:hypothetical protein